MLCGRTRPADTHTTTIVRANSDKKFTLTRRQHATRRRKSSRSLEKKLEKRDMSHKL